MPTVAHRTDFSAHPTADGATDLATILKPLFVIAAVAFVLGFAGYLAVLRMSLAAPTDRLQPVYASDIGADPANPPRKT